jgi:hypothetical protein
MYIRHPINETWAMHAKSSMSINYCDGAKTRKTNDFKRNSCNGTDTAGQDTELEMSTHFVMLNVVIRVFMAYDTIIILHTYVLLIRQMGYHTYKMLLGAKDV